MTNLVENRATMECYKSIQEAEVCIFQELNYVIISANSNNTHVVLIGNSPGNPRPYFFENGESAAIKGWLVFWGYIICPSDVPQGGQPYFGLFSHQVR